MKKQAIRKNIRRFKLLRHVLIVVLAMTIALSVYNVFFIYPAYIELVIDTTKKDAVRVARYLATSLMYGDPEPGKNIIDPQFSQEIDRIIQVFELNKLKIFSPAGKTIFSTDPKEIGLVNPKKYFHAIVAKGKLYAEIVPKDAVSMEGQKMGSDVIEIYVPRMMGDKFLGAFEFYYDITDRKTEFDKLLSRSSKVLFTMVFGLLITIAIMWFRESKAIDERNQAEKALIESEKRHRMLFEKAGDAIFILEAQGAETGKIVTSNQAGAQMHGYDLDEIIGKNIQDLNAPDAAKEFSARIQRIMEGTWIKEEINHRQKDGSIFPVEVSAGLLELDKRNFVLAFYRDITEKKFLQAETARACQLASIGELAAGVAHEINNPVNGIINCAQLLLDTEGGSGEQTEISQRILKAGGRIAMIVRNLLSFARNHEEEPERVDINSILADSLDLTEAQIRKDGIDLRIRIPADIPEVQVRSHQIQQVFLNVISNARYALNQKFPRANTNKVLEIKGESVETNEKKYARVTFYDQGSGIAVDIMDRICDPFFSNKPSGEGTGLGLSISQSIIKEHGGDLLFESVEGEYARVIIDLPAAEENVGE
jgi:PAS domain S-box-containing protein